MTIPRTDGIPTPGYDEALDKIKVINATLEAKIDTLNTKIDNIIAGTSPAVTTLSGSILQEQQTQADATDGVLTFTANISTIEIYNTDTVNAGTFEANGMIINVPATKVFKASIGGTPGATVTIVGATTYIVSRYV